MAKPAAKSTAKKTAPKRLPRDVDQFAPALIKATTGRGEEIPSESVSSEISRYMSQLGRRGGKIGGDARAAKLTPQRRKEIALRAASARWKH
jgi:hypothetical protein